VVKAAALALAVCLLAAASGCALDERVIDVRPDPLVIDTFEDMNLMPSDSRFRQWESAVYGTDFGTRTVYVTGPGYASSWCLREDWEIDDPPDGVPTYPGMVLRIQAPGSVDLSGFRTLAFDHRYSHEGSCKAHVFFTVSMSCGELNSGVGVARSTATDWTIEKIPMAEFAEFTPDFPIDHCLKLIDEIDFFFAPGLDDGQCSSGSFFLDDFRFE
jgi:hypothetical protein